MEQPITIFNVPVERVHRQSTPQSDIADMREMFREMNQRYMVYQPSPYYYRVKRVMDIAMSGIFIILVMSWLYPIVALLIKLTSKGPVFFIKKRTGYKG